MPASPFHQDKLRQAHALQMQGRLGEAADLYRAVLAEDPRNAPALHLLGVLVMQAGQIEPGVELVRQSLTILPGFAPAQENLGKGLEQLGRREEALEAYDRLIKLAPGHAEGYAHRSRVLESVRRFSEALKDIDKALSLKREPKLLLNRGAILLQLQRPADALSALDKAIAAGLQHPLAYFNRGLALMALFRREEALASYDEALLRQPDYADAFVNRGLVLESLNRADEALASYDRALSIAPDLTEAKLNRGALLVTLGRRSEALADYDEAIARDPGAAGVYSNRGVVLRSMGDMEGALADFDRAAALAPQEAPFHDNRALALQSLGRFDEALGAFDRALAVDPASERSRLHRSMLSLLLGDFASGMPAYRRSLIEQRERLFTPEGVRPEQTWLGSAAQPIAGKTLLIYSDQGMGDNLMFARYLGSLKAQGANVIFSLRDSLQRLFRSFTPAVSMIAENAMPASFDYHVPLGALPMLLGTTLDTVPADIPYLQAEPERVAAWRERLGGHGFRIGVSWQGKTKGFNDPFRSFPLAALAPLAALPGVRLISLQKGDGSEQVESLPAGMTVEQLGDDFDAGFDAFIDSAAVMEACDLVVTCDTSIAHLAGALGRPVWTALKSVPDWRWLLERKDTPWYPSMTLYRQPGLGDWDSVFAAMTRDLSALLEGRTPG